MGKISTLMCRGVLIAVGMLLCLPTFSRDLNLRPYPGPINVDSGPGCDFNGNCLSVLGNTIHVHGRSIRFSMDISDAWRLKSALGPIDQEDAVGLDLVDISGKATIALRYCPKSGVCADDDYGSAQDYERAMIKQQVKLRRDNIKAGRELPVIDSGLKLGNWKGKQGFEFSYAYAGEIHSATQKTFPDRMRRDVVLIPTREGLFVATYATAEMNFPAETDEFRKVLASLMLSGMQQLAEVQAQPVPQFPALRQIADADARKDRK